MLQFEYGIIYRVAKADNFLAEFIYGEFSVVLCMYIQSALRSLDEQGGTSCLQGQTDALLAVSKEFFLIYLYPTLRTIRSCVYFLVKKNINYPIFC